MTKTTYWILALTGVALVSGCHRQPSPRSPNGVNPGDSRAQFRIASRLFDWKVGFRQTHRMRIVPRKGPPYVITLHSKVVERKAIKGGFRLVIARKVRPSGRPEKDFKTILEVTTAGVTETTSRDTYWVIRPPYVRGKKWQTGKKMSFNRVAITATGESVKVAGGTFRHCLVVVNTYPRLSSMARTHFCPGQGMVKAVSSGRRNTTIELVRTK